MTNAALALAVTAALNRVMAQDRGRLLSALTVRLRDFELAEEVLQDAVMSALDHWGRAGVPQSPTGWLLKVAYRKAIDRFRHAARSARQTADLALLAQEEAAEIEPDLIPDDRLRLIFTCCHPALEPKTRVALTLRTVCGLTTAQVAAVFLDPEPTMGQRLTRAKTKIATAGIPFVIPGPEAWDDRLNAVLNVVYLVFTAGYTASKSVGRDLCVEAIFLARLVVHLRPDQAESEGLLALILLIHSRKAARFGADGAAIALADQDRRLWDDAMRAEGQVLLDRAMARRVPGPFQIKAALQALQSDGGDRGKTDWPQILLLYISLLRWEDTPVVRLNLAVARAEAGDALTALAEVEALGGALSAYQPYHAARADLLARVGRIGESRMAYDRAITLANNPADIRFLEKRRAFLPD
jgi:RNA polymerase sigma-70 factor (ECF subfamily)